MRGPYGKLWTEFFSFLLWPKREAHGPWKQERKKQGSITCRTDRANKANKMFIIWLCWLFRFWRGDQELEVRTATYTVRAWKWPITACEISQPYNNIYLFKDTQNQVVKVWVILLNSILLDYMYLFIFLKCKLEVNSVLDCVWAMTEKLFSILKLVHEISNLACQQLANIYSDVTIVYTASVMKSRNANQTRSRNPKWSVVFIQDQY